MQEKGNFIGAKGVSKQGFKIYKRCCDKKGKDLHMIIHQLDKFDGKAFDNCSYQRDYPKRKFPPPAWTL